MKVVFLDRDGVINKEVGYLHKIEDFEFTYRCIDALKKILQTEYQIIIITNQAGIAKGYFTEEEYQLFTDLYLKRLFIKGIDILDVFYCPNHINGVIPKYTKDCIYRKPKPGMIIEAQKKYNINLEESILVGDKLTDILAGKAAGLGKNILVESGHILSESCKMQSDYVFKDLFSFSKSDVL